jgi:methyltransferase
LTAATPPGTWALGILAFVTLQRLGELALSRRNTRLLLARGAIEAAPEHYPLLVGLHTAWLAGLWYVALVHPIGAIDPALIALFFALQAVRLWVLWALGRRWTTRILVVPGESLIRRGPYRWLAHPNYCVVAGEIMVLPLAFGLVWYAIAFSLLNLILLWLRIGAENKALSGLPPPSSGEVSASSRTEGS